MVRIVKPGKVEDVGFNGTCPRCGCEVECEYTDTTPGPDLWTPVRYVPCPTPDCLRPIPLAAQ